MSNKREPLLSDDELMGEPSPYTRGWYPNAMRSKQVRDHYEAARAKDAELIQQLVDGVIGVYWMRPEASKKLMTELLATAAAAGYKPTDQ
jgi:hypothetical protein